MTLSSTTGSFFASKESIHKTKVGFSLMRWTCLLFPPNLDDVRCGTARVTSRGKVVWLKKLPRRLRRPSLDLIRALSSFKPRRIDYSSIGRKLLTVQPLPVGVHPIYDTNYPGVTLHADDVKFDYTPTAPMFTNPVTIKIDTGSL